VPRRLRQAPLVGRLAETSALDEALRMSAEGTDGGPVAVVIAGDAGTEEPAGRRGVRPGRRRWLAVAERGMRRPRRGVGALRALVDALRVFTAAELPSVLDHWRRGETEPPGPELLPDTARGRVYGTYLDVLRAPSDQAPLALVVEDCTGPTGPRETCSAT
jgi:hypothetical protein